MECSTEDDACERKGWLMREEIGRGIFSTVYRGLHHGTGIAAAIKKIPFLEMKCTGDSTYCMQEIQVLQKLQHPNIIRYIDSFFSGSYLYLVLELGDKGDLADFLCRFRKKRKLLPEVLIWNFFSQLCDGLYHMHSSHILHRDIKPSNVFITIDNTVKLGDLGLSRFFPTSCYVAYSMVGTPFYMSPERFTDSGYDFKSDIWAMGCLLYEMASLKSPFYTRNVKLKELSMKVELKDHPPLSSNSYSDLVSCHQYKK